MPPFNSRDAKAKTPSWDPNVEPFMKLLIGKDGIRTRQAAEVGRRAVEYFRGQDFYRWVAKNSEMIKSETQIGKEILSAEELPHAAQSLGAELVSGGFVYRAKYLPINRSTDPDGGAENIPRWPKRLELSSTQAFEENAFYVVCYEGGKFGRHAMLATIIVAVLVICMFPAWPLMMKLATWYMSVILLTLILGLVFGRLILFVGLWFLGCDFWLFPNLFNEDVGVVDSFIPLFTFEYRRDGWLMVVGRLFCAVLVAASIYQLGQTHSILDVQNFAKRQFLDVLDWGHQKLAPPPELQKFQPAGSTDPLIRVKVSPSTMKSQKSNEDVEEDIEVEVHEDYTCLQACGFSTLEELMDECITECRCMEELTSSPCYRKCPENTKKSLSEARQEACTESEEEQTIDLDEEEDMEGDAEDEESTKASSNDEL